MLVHVFLERLEAVRRDRHALCFRDRGDLARRGVEHLPHVRIFPDVADRQARRAGESGERHEIHELVPDRHARVGDRRHLNVRRRQHVGDRLHARRDRG